VIVRIGAVAMVTLIVLPAIRRGELGPNPLSTFKAIERRFSWHARIALLIVGLSGLSMLDRRDLWEPFNSLEFWWVHATLAVRTLCALLLCVIEPTVVHRAFDAAASRRPGAALRSLQRSHWLRSALVR